jgi:hypothetical protein
MLVNRMRVMAWRNTNQLGIIWIVIVNSPCGHCAVTIWRVNDEAMVHCE